MENVLNNQKLWDSYHEILLGPDIGRIRKMLVRYDLYQMSKDVPGDIIECGVFKGAGLMYWLKVLSIYEPDSQKKVIGFDTFTFFAGELTEKEKVSVKEYLKESDSEGVSAEQVYSYAQKAGLRKRVDLVEGDIARTAKAYVGEKPDLQISLLHLDLDTYDGTKAALEALYPSVSPGGIIVFDEYGDEDWGETKAIDKYFADQDVNIKRIPCSTKPSAYIIKRRI